MAQDFNLNRYAGQIQDTDFMDERTLLCAKHVPTEGKVLEIGVWHGKNTQIYKKYSNADFYGIDLALENMAQAMPLLKEAKACDVGQNPIPWEDGSFDCVICTEVIEHVFDTDYLLEQVFRVLKNTGRLIISTPNLASLSNRLMLGLLGWQPIATEVSCRKSNYGNPLRKSLKPAGHIRDFTHAALCDQLKEHGFAIQGEYSIPLIAKQPFALLERLAIRISPALGGNSIVVCTKS